jgi:hypothetical protein
VHPAAAGAPFDRYDQLEEELETAQSMASNKDELLRADHVTGNPQSRQLPLQSKAKPARFVGRVNRRWPALLFEPRHPTQERFFGETLPWLGIGASFLASHHVKRLVHIDSELDRSGAAIKLTAGFLE